MNVNFGARFLVPKEELKKLGSTPLAMMPGGERRPLRQKSVIIDASTPDNKAADTMVLNQLVGAGLSFLVKSSMDGDGDSFAKARDKAPAADRTALSESLEKGEPAKWEALA